MSSKTPSSQRPSGAQITTTVTTTVGMSLTLLLIGLLIVLGFLGVHWERQLRQEARVQVFFQREVEANVLLEAKEMLRTDPAVASVSFIKAEEASADLEEQLGESFVDFLGYVPLSDVMDLRMKPDWSTTEELENAVQRMEQIPGISEVVWQSELLEQIEATIERLMAPLAGLALLFMFAAFALMNNTIRLTIFARRFVIKTMQLVGAHPRAIRSPFIRQGIFYGVISGGIAFTAINGILSMVTFQNAALLEPFNLIYLGALFLILTFIGGVFGGVSTAFAVNRFLRSRLDRLH
ncbi:permease-like cell division protein FtsX [Flavobacteriales bacterium]|jgi:cell division transport system permease protein|nr:permease-like cell division protein FtsX [Flavobacteriales bacterium]